MAMNGGGDFEVPQRRTFAGLSLDRPLIMGIINVTPDSFSDGGETSDSDAAIARGRQMMADGADIIDIGGESTRPGADPVAIDEELRRVVPVVAGLSEHGAVVSIDTRHAAVMRAAIAAGARIVNDVTALTGDADSLPTVAEANASVILMHMRGTPKNMQNAPTYGDAASEIRQSLENWAKRCVRAGMERSRIAIDPGIGFGKTLQHNLDIIRAISVFRGSDYTLCIGASRKSFIGSLCKEPVARNRLGGSIAAALSAVDRGTDIVRVHDVAATRQALQIWQAINPCARDST